MISLPKVTWLGALALVSPIMAIGQSEILVAAGHSFTIPESMEGRRSPIWSGGSLIVPQGPMGEENAFRAYDGSGRMVFNATFTVPEADHTYVRGFSRGADGILAICGLSSLNDGSSAPFLATISSDGGSQRLVRTAPYTPNVVVVAPDGTFWTVGRELDARLSEKSGVNLEAGVLRHFDKSGKLLSAFVPRSTISDTTTLASGQSFLVASSDRVGWLRFTPVGQASYMEVTADDGGYQQINFEVPQEAVPNPDGTWTVTASQNGTQITTQVALLESPRDFFLVGSNLGAFQHSADFSLVTDENPAHPGEVLVGYLTGLPGTEPVVPTSAFSPFSPLAVVPQPNTTALVEQFAILLNGAVIANDCLVLNAPCEASNILFLGLTPGSAGLYQVNFVVPFSTGTGQMAVQLQRSRCATLSGSPCGGMGVPFLANAAAGCVALGGGGTRNVCTGVAAPLTVR